MHSSESRPVIAITGPDIGGAAMWWFTRLGVWRAGGRAVRVTVSRPLAGTPISGLILGGGSDISAELYGMTPLNREKPATPRRFRTIVRRLIIPPLLNALRWLVRVPRAPMVDPQRDALELDLLKRAVAGRLPVLGICRGEQLLNVYYGGTLHQDLAGFYVETPEIRSITPRKRVEILPGTALEEVVGRRVLHVNALHRQGVNELGRDVVVNARDANGIVQGIEVPALPFCIGVQWHPEFLPHIASHQRLFVRLVDMARARRPPADIENPAQAEDSRNRGTA